MKQLKIKQKKQKSAFLPKLLGTLAASFLGNALTKKKKSNKSRCGSNLLPHDLTNFEIQKNDQSEQTFNGVYSRNNLSKRKGWVINNKFWWVWINRDLLDITIWENRKYKILWWFWS